MDTKINYFKSIKTRLFLSLCIIVISIIAVLILLNNFVLKQFYEFNKKNQLIDVYYVINNYYNSDNIDTAISDELNKISLKNNFNILIKNNFGNTIQIFILQLKI